MLLGEGVLLRGHHPAVICPAPAHGAVAQLGERLNGIQEVRGSIPLGSTRFLNNTRDLIKEDTDGTRITEFLKLDRHV